MVISFMFAVMNFRRREKVKVMEVKAFFSAALFPTIKLIIYFHVAAYAGNFNSIQNGHISVITYVICKFHG